MNAAGVFSLSSLTNCRPEKLCGAATDEANFAIDAVNPKSVTMVLCG